MTKFVAEVTVGKRDRLVTLRIPADFLEPGRTYLARIYADGPDADWTDNPLSYEITERRVTAADTLDIRMAAGGGQAISFIAEK